MIELDGRAPHGLDKIEGARLTIVPYLPISCQEAATADNEMLWPLGFLLPDETLSRAAFPLATTPRSLGIEALEPVDLHRSVGAPHP